MARTSPTDPWTKEDLLAALWRHPGRLERAMVLLLERQTTDERSAERTHHSNGRGFTAFHARTGTKLGKYALNGGTFGPVWKRKAYVIAKVHAGQLVEEANRRLSERVAAAAK